MPRLCFLTLLHYCRTSSRLIQSLALAFVLSLGAASIAPVVQAANLSPDQQIICAGTGGMKVVTFAADGSAQEVKTAHGLDCPLCGALQTLPPASLAPLGLSATAPAKPIWQGLAAFEQLALHAPPARAPPQHA